MINFLTLLIPAKGSSVNGSKRDVSLEIMDRKIKREQEVTQEDIQTKFSDIRLHIDLSDFVQAGILVETEASAWFVKKSSSEMKQSAYHLGGATDDIMIDIDI